MKRDLNILNDKNTVDLLELLDESALTKEELILRLHLPEKKVSDMVDSLVKNGWLICSSDVYHLNKEAFRETAEAFLQFSKHKEDDDNIYRIDVNSALCDHFFKNREMEFHYAAFDREISFYESVRSGNMETVKTLFTPLGGEGFGTMSHDPLQNLKYHLIVSIAMITRFCINGGMTPEDAYSLSDVYVMKTDRSRTIDEIHAIHYEMTVDFTRRMRQIKSGFSYSKPIIHALDYISDHLHSRILIEDVAEHLSLSVPYLSRLFKSELGMAFSKYVMIKKIEAAASMLQFSDYSAIDISNYFAFSSQSYFIKVFRSHMGITPKEYRDKYYAVGWMSGKIDNRG